MSVARLSFLGKVRNRRPLGSLLLLFGLAMASLLGALQVGCGGGGSSAAMAAPTSLTFATNPAAYTKGVAIPANAPHSSGGAVASYKVSPVLPAGLTLDATTGVISGTPTAVTAQTAFTVTATNAGGSTDCYLLVAVKDVAPAGLSYSEPTVAYTKGVAITSNAPTVSGGAVTRYSVSPALPSGLVLDAATGVISGTPTAVTAQATYHVTATNSGGSVTFDLAISVKDIPPSNLSYASNPATYLRGVQISPNRPTSSGGAITSYSIAPALPAGLSLDSSTGLISGRPTVLAIPANYTVTALNSGGGTTCTLSIAVGDVPPYNLTYADNAPIYTRGIAIPGNLPTNAGGTVTGYSIAPALPAGLSLDPVSGLISGTPLVVYPATAHTVTASNTGGSTTCQVTITVREASPTALVYTTNPSSYTINVPIQPNTPSHGGGAITSYTVNPALPAGLVLDPGTGVISGTPTALTPQATYVITGSNSTGSATCNFVTSVVASAVQPPATPVVTAAAYVTTGQTALQASTQDQGTANGMSYTWTLTNGTITGGQGTPAITYTAGAVGTLTLDVKVMNLGGTATGTRNVTVVAVPLAQLFAQDKVLCGTRAQASVADQPGMTYHWTLSGPGAGTILSGTTNVVTYTAGTTPGTYQLSVDVQSPVGGTASATRTLNAVVGQFLLDAQTSRQRYGHTVTHLRDGRLLVAGGDDTHAAPTGTAELFDPYSHTWAPTGPMAVKRAFHAEALLPDGRVLVTGGMDPSGAMLDSAEIYDPATNAWTSAPHMDATRQDHTATVLANGTVLVAGGFGLDSGGTQGGYLSSAEIFDPATQSWTSITPMNTARSNHSATLLQNGLVLMAAGVKASNTAGWLNTSELYDPLLQTWTPVGNLTTSRYNHTATLLGNGKVLVAAGYGVNGALADGEIFNPASGTWAVSANRMAYGHSAPAAALLPSGQVLVAGGSTGASAAAVDTYDPATNRWTVASAMSAGRSRPIAATLPTGKVLVTGGMGNTSHALGNPETYDPASNTWTVTGMQDASRFGHTATKLADGTVLVAGGSGSASYIGTTETYDPSTGAWAGVAPLANARLYHTASLLSDGTVLVAGGLGTGGTTLNSVELYTPSTKAWSNLASLAVARLYHTATVLQNGKILIVGGMAGATTLASAELYDPATGLWTSASSLAIARANHTATLLPSGKVLVAGGGTSSAYYNSVEIYDPAANTWTAAAPMFSPRVNATATLLADGSVLMIGGQRDTNTTVAGTEAYNPATNTWAARGSLNAGRYAHAATLLPDGRVLVTGGLYTTNQTSQTADLFDPAAQLSTTLPMTVSRAYHTATLLDASGLVLVLGGSPGSTPESWKP